MIRMIVTFAVGLGMLVGIGAWFDPEGARDAIRRDLSGLAGQAADRAGAMVREAVARVVETPSSHAPVATPDEPQAGPRTGKKRPPVIAAVATPTGSAPTEKSVAVEEVHVAAREDFVEAPLARSVGIAPVSSRAQGLAGLPLAPPESQASAPDAGEQGLLIRRMLALYERVSERR